jgi:hypothetical protein
MIAISTLELHITYRCNMRCHNCSNLIMQAPARLDMSPALVQSYVEDWVENSYPWVLITIHGGEPCLHPKCVEIAQLLLDYKRDHNPKVTLWWLTNWSSPIVKERAGWIRDMGISLGPADKGIEQPYYVPVNKSPRDVGVEPTEGCFQLTDCGMALNVRGYYPCSPMASAARVFDYPPMCASCSGITESSALAYAMQHCEHCGFALPNEPRVNRQVTTPTWETKLGAYRESVHTGNR